MSRPLTERLMHGAIAGAVGTAALNATTYLDMAVRGRPPSTTPERTVERLAELVRLPVPGGQARRAARLTGIGALLGTLAGVSAGVAMGAIRPLVRDPGGPATTALAFGVAMTVGNGPMTMLRVTDPRTWSASDWAADVLPHTAYAVAAAATWHALGRRRG